jgi:putative intracellular protease/amidase
MSSRVDVLNPTKPKRILMVASNVSKSQTTGWDIGVWAAELVHPWFEFTEHGYEVDIVSPDGGKLHFDSLSDPRDPSGYSAHDLLSMGFLNTPRLMALTENTPQLADVTPDSYDGLFVCGGQGPMYTFINNETLHQFFAAFYETGKVTAVICHGTCILLKTRLSNGSLLIEGKTWTGFADSEEDYADQIVGKKLQPFRIEEEARKLPIKTNYINGGQFRAFAVRDGNLITGQQQYSGTEAARLVIAALGQ